MQLNCKVIKKWQPPISTSAPPFQGYLPLSSKILGSPPSDSIFGRSYPPLIRGGWGRVPTMSSGLITWPQATRLLSANAGYTVCDFTMKMFQKLYV